jgi:hypothetical protein
MVKEYANGERRSGGQTKNRDDPDKFVKGKYGHMVQR